MKRAYQTYMKAIKSLLKSVLYWLHNDQNCKKKVTGFVLMSQFDVMFHLFRNSIATSIYHKKLAPGAYYVLVPNVSVGETG